MSGFSSEPLLEACRKLQRIGVPPPEEVGLFRPDYQNWDLKTTVGYGASQEYGEAGHSMRLRNYHPHPRSSLPLIPPRHLPLHPAAFAERFR